ncbi:hypothetical protein A7K94_0201775 [Modestobacter sp. VKM Ac-2676]|nr:hypothetical protein A7K94_0201775 [Modestobacter sp. VKM Ac-2676]
MKNAGDTALTIESVHLIDYRGPDSAAQVVNAGLYSLQDRGALAAGYWPKESDWPEDGLLPAAGYVLDPDDEIAAFFVAEGLVEGAYGWRGVEVQYEVAGRGYREQIDNGFVICAPRERLCPLRETLGVK